MLALRLTYPRLDVETKLAKSTGALVNAFAYITQQSSPHSRFVNTLYPPITTFTERRLVTWSLLTNTGCAVAMVNH